MVKKRREGSVQFNVRIPKRLAAELRDYAARGGLSRSAAALQFLEEGVRMAQYPGIDFRWTRTGRRPHVTGTGLSVWEMYTIWRDHREDVSYVRENYPPFTAAQILAGAAYAKAYLREMPPPAAKPPYVREIRVS